MHTVCCTCTFTVWLCCIGEHQARNLEQLERVLRGDHQFGMPFDAIQSLDVVMRHLPSMRCVYHYRSCTVDYMWDTCVGPGLGLLGLAT